MRDTPTKTAASATAAPDLLVDQRDHVLRLTINREHRRNAVTESVLRGLAEAIANASRDPAVHAIVLTGAGDKAFCAGADLTPGDTPFRPDFSRLTLPLAD